MNADDATDCRWLTPDSLAGDLTNPQSLSRYAYALNNPTTLVDPSGLDAINCTIRNGCKEPGGNACTWANGCRADIPGLGAFDNGCTLDGIAFNCGLIPQVIGAGITTVGDSGNVVGNTIFVNGQECVTSTIGGQSHTTCTPTSSMFTLPGAGGTPGLTSPGPSADVPLNPAAQAIFTKVYHNLAFLDPEPCGHGTFGFRGGEYPVGPGRVGFYPVVATQDSQSGNSVGYLYEGGFGPVSLGRETSVNLSSGQATTSTLLFLGAGAGVFAVPGRSQIQLGVYASGNRAGAGAYVDLVPGGTCNQ